MKKLLALVLVLGVVSIANAGLLYDADATAPFELTITYQDTPDTACDVYIDYSPLAAAGLDISAATLTGTGASIANLYILTAGVDGIDAYYLALGSTGDFATGAELAVFDLNGDAANVGSTPVTLDLYNGNAEPAGQVCVMIPEPATMVLLSLGGLLLRRKK